MIAVVVLLAGLLAGPATAQSPAAAIAVPASDPVTVSGGLGATRTWRGNRVPFWISIRNRTAATLDSVAVASPDAIVAIVAICAASSSSTCESAPTALAAGQDVVMHGEIEVRAVAELSPSLIVRWDAAGTPGVAAVKVGPLKSESYTWSWITWGLGWIPNLALPIALLYAGHVYERRRHREQEQTRQHERDLESRRQEDSSRRAELRQQQETRRAEQQEVVRMMLPLSHSYAIKHYATILTRARNAVKSVSRYREAHHADGKQAALDAVTYDIVALYTANRRLIAKVGAYYFKDRAGEELVVAAFYEFSGVLFLVDQGASKAITPVIDVIERTSPLPQATFESMIAANTNASAKLAIVRHRIEDWIRGDSCEAGLGYLAIFCAVLEFEMNRPYEDWYGASEPLALPAEHSAALRQIYESHPENADRFRKYAAAHAGKPAPPGAT